MPGGAKYINTLSSVSNLYRCLARLFSAHSATLFSGSVDRSRYRKPCEKQVAMIAQKVVDANHAEDEWCRLVPFSNPRTTALGTSLGDHLTWYAP
jgi:hypothetical protein